jgi:hypothetical protein
MWDASGRLDCLGWQEPRLAPGRRLRRELSRTGAPADSQGTLPLPSSVVPTLWTLRLGADTNMTRLHNHKSPTQPLPVLPHEPTDAPNQTASSIPREPDQDDTRRIGVADKDQPTEIPVLRQENALLTGCLLNHLSRSSERWVIPLNATTSWPSARKARTTAKSQLSSARKRSSAVLITPPEAGSPRAPVRPPHSVALPGCLS